MITDNTKRYEENNSKYVRDFKSGSLTLIPSKQIAIVTCMDARIHPESIFGLEIGEAHVIRNAGGRASESLRSLIISQRLLRTKEIIVVHHTDCGMLTFTDEDLRNQLKKETNGLIVDHFSFLPFKDLKQSVIDDVEYLKNQDFILKDIPVTGYIYNVESGKLEKITD